MGNRFPQSIGVLAQVCFGRQCLPSKISLMTSHTTKNRLFRGVRYLKNYSSKVNDEGFPKVRVGDLRVDGRTHRQL